MQLVSILSLLVLGVPALLTLAASLPYGQASNATSTGHSLHRRVNGPTAADHYRFDDDIEVQLAAGVLRHPSELAFYDELQRAILDIQKISSDLKTKLMNKCDEAWTAIKTQLPGPIPYDTLYARSLTYTAQLNTIDANLRQRLDKILHDTINGDREHILPQKVAEAIITKLRAYPSEDDLWRQQAFYDFLRQRVFGYKIPHNVFFKRVVRTLLLGESTEDIELLNGLIIELGSAFHYDHIYGISIIA